MQKIATQSPDRPLLNYLLEMPRWPLGFSPLQFAIAFAIFNFQFFSPFGF